MKTNKQEYRDFIRNNFQSLRLRKPLFYSYDFGLRFNLQIGEFNSEEYFLEVIKRATQIFETAFNESDKVFFIMMDYKHKRRKIRFSNFAFKQIKNLQNSDIIFTKENRIYEPNDKLDIRNVAIVKTEVCSINYSQILTAIGNTDFGGRQPRLEQNYYFSSKELYFINIDKKLILHMYDDRGLDIIATNIETLRPIYSKHLNWLLDYDRESIEKQFK